MRWVVSVLWMAGTLFLVTPLCAGPLYDEGLSLFQDEAYKKASRRLEKSFEKEKGTASDAALLLSQCYEEMGKTSRAIDTLKKGQRNDPENWDILYRLGDLQDTRGDYFGALEAFAKASILKPRDTKTTFRLGMLYDKTAQIEKALKVYRKLRKEGSPYAERLLHAIQGIE
ncbi:MAG: tetratricopeptide repeat protein [Desulfobacterales bacterium]|nr:tetratricopeptide repeat protein [Desulfobacterales bacterium]